MHTHALAAPQRTPLRRSMSQVGYAHWIGVFQLACLSLVVAHDAFFALWVRCVPTSVYTRTLTPDHVQSSCL
jgi:hypothetical protein